MTDQPAASTVTAQTSAAIFIVLRKMRAPLVLLIVIFAITVLGMAVIPGDSPDGPWRMGLFNAFYFMSYTATTIGFGEIPHPFNTAQRLWVTFSIYLTVIGWAYAIGSLLALLQQSAFKQALAVQRFHRRVGRLSEDFWIIAGHGQAGGTVGVALDALGRRFVALDISPDRIDVIDLGSYISDVPGLVADARDPEILKLAGITHPRCAGLLAFTNDDETNLAILMAASVLRPGLEVIARSTSSATAARMTAFGSPVVVNPFDVFGDHLRIELHAPAAERLTRWLGTPPGTPLPAARTPLRSGLWIVCDSGGFGEEVARDLRDAGAVVTAVAVPGSADSNPTDPQYLRSIGAEQATGFVAGSDNDITNLSLVAAARHANPGILVIARQNQPQNAELFAAMDCQLLMVPGQIAAEEALTHIGMPLLRAFSAELKSADNSVAESLLARVVDAVGEGSPEVWTLRVNQDEAPALMRVLAATPVTVSDLCRSPLDRHTWLPAVPLMIQRGGVSIVAPGETEPLEADDVLLLASDAGALRSIESTVNVDDSAAYVFTGEHVGASWLWRALSR